MSDRSKWYKIIDLVPKEDDFDFRLRQIAECRCGREYPFLSQEDESLEYYTQITLECECGCLLSMKFPID